ncbi:MAG: GNAT family N-acetyltransferase [Burkholderiaceae bacterium]
MAALTTARVTLQPLLRSHADAMFLIVGDATLYRYLDNPPHPSIDHTRDVYARLESRRSPDGTQLWLNWIVAPHGRPPIGYVQATIGAARTAWIAYFVAVAEWGNGYATEAVLAMKAHLAAEYGVVRFLATVEAGNAKSVALLGRVGLRPATEEEALGHDLAVGERLFVG